MARIPDPVSRQHVDEDSDDVFQARQNIHDFGNAINGIREYLTGLFSVDGEKTTAIATLFSNQAVLFPSNTQMVFLNKTVPPGWFLVGTDQPRYLVTAPAGWGGWLSYGDFNVSLQASPTVLVQGHLPAITLGGWTDAQGYHNHVMPYSLRWNWVGTVAGHVRVREGGEQNWVYFNPESHATHQDGMHQHNVGVNLGGGNWPHDHWVNMSNYRPLGLTIIIGSKA